MCGRFAQFSPLDILRERFFIDHVTCPVNTSYNIAPSQKILSIINHDGNRLGELTWGLIPFWVKEQNSFKGLINAKEETLSEKPSFKEPFRKRRCLIIVDGFYEWEKKGTKKQPFYFFMPDKKPFAFAGLWDTCKSGNSEKVNSCTIITKKAKGAVSKIHHRMPVILNAEKADIWLDKNTNETILKNIMNDLSNTQLCCHPVNPKMNSVWVNTPECIINYKDRCNKE